MTDKTVFILNSARLGQGPEDLGKKLMGSFLRGLLTLEQKPEALIFYNEAVQLLSPESPNTETLKQLEDCGVDLLACVTCLEYFHLTDQLAVGSVSNMREIIQVLLSASKTVTV